jgi:hypothetical protein
MLSFIGSAITPNISRLGDGSLLCRNVILARSGIQMYRPIELGLEGEKLIPVERPESEVFSPECMASFEGTTVVDDHPGSGHITTTSWRAYAMGHVQNIRRGPRVNGDLTLIGDLIVNDSQLIEKILAGKREVSCGYDCEYVPAAGGSYRQQQIRGNHVAIVNRGRASNARILDAAAVATRLGRELARAYDSYPELRPEITGLDDVLAGPANQNHGSDLSEQYAAQMRAHWRK